MKSQLNFKKAIITLLFVIISAAVFAQTGKISGKVSDKSTGETLIGVTVKIAGTTKGAATDVEGRYVISGVEPGKITLEISYVGYTTKNITGVEVKANSSTVVDLIMEESTDQKLNEVVITANVNKESVNVLYVNQKSSISVSSGISAELIRKSPDKNTSEVLKRVSGASIQDNKFVIIRGLADRYNSSTLNGALLPSTETDKKAFSFDIIPSNMIDRIIISKTASADLPGDFSGGVVQVFTKDVPDQNFIDFSYGVAYNSLSTFKDLNTGARASSAYFGFDDGSRSLPSSFDPGTYGLSSTPQSQKYSVTKNFNNNWGIQSSKALPSQNGQLTWGNRKNLSNDGVLGSIVSLSYRNTQSINVAERYDYENTDVVLDYKGNQNRFSTNMGLLANLAYVKGNNKIAWKNTVNRVFDDATTVRNGINIQKQGDVRDYIYVLNEKTLISSQLEGDHKFGEKEYRLNWNANYAYNNSEQPDLRALGYVRSFSGYNGQAYPNNPYLAQVPRGASASNDARRFTSILNEHSTGAALNITRPYELFSGKSNLKFGYMGQYKIRDFGATVLGYVVSNPNIYDEAAMASLSPDEIFSPENIGNNGFVLSDITNANDKYDANSFLNSGYVMTDNTFGKLRSVLGARVESYIQNVGSRGKSGEVYSGKATYLDVLPSLNLTYALTDITNLRLSASRTVSRPELREVSAFSYYDFVAFSSVSGNPDLKRSQNTNLDFKYEVYPASGETFSVSLFYKDFRNAIEQIILPGSNIEYRLRSFSNVTSAQTYGAEIEVRKKLSFIADNNLFNNLTFFANGALINSSVDLSGVEGAVGDRPLQGQSPYLINSGLQYVEPNSSIGFNVLYNRIGHRISDVGFVGYTDIYENSRDVIDLQLSKRLLNNRAELKLNVSDILNQNSLFYQNTDGKRSYSAGDNVINRARFGSTYSLTFSYNFRLKAGN